MGRETPKNNKGGGSSHKGRAAALFLSVHTKSRGTQTGCLCLFMDVLI